MKRFDKKVFFRLMTVFAVLDLCLLMAGCGDWESQASNIITLLGPAIQSAIAILAAFGVGVSQDVMSAFNKWSAEAQADLANIKDLIAQFKASAASAQPGILSQIQTAVTTTAQNLTEVLAMLHITNETTQAKVMAVFGAISGMLAAVAALLPAINGQVADNHEKLRLFRVYQTAANNFKKDFNSAAAYFGEKYELK
jgi:hypothetical protein